MSTGKWPNPIGVYLRKQLVRHGGDLDPVIRRENKTEDFSLLETSFLRRGSRIWMRLQVPESDLQGSVVGT